MVQGLLERLDEFFPESAHFVSFAVAFKPMLNAETAVFLRWRQVALLALRVSKEQFHVRLHSAATSCTGIGVHILSGVRMVGRQVSASEFKAKCLRIIKEMQDTGEAVTVTRRGQPVAVVSLPPSTEPMQSFIGSLRGTVVKYDDPLESAAPSTD